MEGDRIIDDEPRERPNVPAKLNEVDPSGDVDVSREIGDEGGIDSGELASS
jgi:hypothetical protein